MNVTLFQPDIAQNLGAILRLSACFDIPLGIIEPCGFPLTDKALRRTALDYGTSADINRHASWSEFRQSQSKKRIILFTTKAAMPLPDFKFHPDDSLLFGSESKGAPDFVHETAFARVIVPQAIGMRSFNLATSVAIGVYEALRQTGGLSGLSTDNETAGKTR